MSWDDHESVVSDLMSTKKLLADARADNFQLRRKVKSLEKGGATPAALSTTEAKELEREEVNEEGAGEDG